MRASCLVAAAAALSASACWLPTDVEEVEHVAVHANRSGVSIENGRLSTIFHFAVDRKMAPVILWAPCTKPDECDGIHPFETRQVAASRITGWGESDEIIVYWWELEPAGAGELRPDSIRSIIVKRR